MDDAELLRALAARADGVADDVTARVPAVLALAGAGAGAGAGAWADAWRDGGPGGSGLDWRGPAAAAFADAALALVHRAGACAADLHTAADLLRRQAVRAQAVQGMRPGRSW